MLTVSNLTKRFGATVAVADASFEVKPGEIYSLIGPNGSGKTTIVKTIAGLLRPNGGGISVGGFDTVSHPIETKRIIGYIPDDPFVWPAMTGKEFLQFIGTLYGMSEALQNERIAVALSQFQLSGIEEGLFGDYARGNKQKFAILAAIMHEPKLLLVDEPIVGLDPASAGVAKKLFKDFAARGGAVLLVTHTLSVAEEISTRIGILKEGKISAEGTYEELCRKSRHDAGTSLERVYMALTS